MTSDQNSSQTETPKRPTSIVEVVLGSLAFGVAGALLVLVFGMWHWERIEVLLGGYLLGVLLPVTLGAFVMSKKPAHAIVAFIAVLVTGAPLVAWHLPEARAGLVSTVGTLMPTHALLRGLADEDPNVARAVCVAVVAKGYDEVQYVTDAFARRPTSSILCLSQDVPDTDADELLRRDLTRIWEKSILEDPEAQCSAVDAYTQMAPLVYGDVAARLLRMSFGAANQDTESCARKAFTDAYPTALKRLEGLGNPEDVDFNVGALLFDDLIQAGYSSVSNDADKKLMEDPMLTQWTMSLGCSLLGTGTDDKRTIRSLNQAMVAADCGAADGDGSGDIWVSTCERGVSPKTGFVTQEKLCKLIGEYAREEAIGFAQTIVHSGIELMQWQATKNKIEAGYARRAGTEYDSRFVPMQMMGEALSNPRIPVGVAHDLSHGVSTFRQHSGAASKHIRSGSVRTLPVTSDMMEMVIAGGKGGSFMGQNMRKMVKDNGGDPDTVFGKSNMKAFKTLLKKTKKKEEEKDEDELEYEDLFGSDDDEQDLADDLKKKRKKRKKERLENPEEKKPPPWAPKGK